MTEPVCRMCWMGTLTPAQQERARAEADTMPSHYCDEHQQIINNMLDSLGWGNIKIMGATTGRFSPPKIEHTLTIPDGWNKPGGERPSCSCGAVFEKGIKTSPQGWHTMHVFRESERIS